MLKFAIKTHYGRCDYDVAVTALNGFISRSCSCACVFADGKNSTRSISFRDYQLIRKFGNI